MKNINHQVNNENRLIDFVKIHGLGNDFVVAQKNTLLGLDLTELAKKISNRHLGIGCDQFIVYQNMGAYYEMEIYNADGSQAEACGNGTRCLARLIYEVEHNKVIHIKVGSRDLQVEINNLDDIIVNMGAVSFEKPWMLGAEKIWTLARNYNLNPRDIICADVGNPHLVIFSQELNDSDRKLLGAKFSDTEFFVDGVNVNFAQIHDNNIILYVWERGAGLTLSCGSGTCATFAAATKLGYIDSSKECRVIFPHGKLSLAFNEAGEVLLSGGSSLVARGVFYL